MLKFLRGLRLASASVALLALAYVAISTVQIERQIGVATVAAENGIAKTAEAVPGIVDSRLEAIQKQTLGLVGEHLTRIEGTVNGAVGKADAQLTGIQGIATEQLEDANRTIATVARAASSALPVVTGSVSQALGGIASDVHKVTVPIAGVAAQLNDAAPMYLDCDPATGGGQDCVFNRTQGILKAGELSAQAVAKAAPNMAESAVKIQGSVEAIAANARRETDILMRPKKWWQRALGYLNLVAIAAAHAI